MAKPPFGKHALPVSHTHMTAAAMITAAIAAATAIAHSCAAWYASLRHRDIRFTRCSSNFWPNDSISLATALIFAVSGELAVSSALYS